MANGYSGSVGDTGIGSTTHTSGTKPSTKSPGSNPAINAAIILTSRRYLRNVHMTRSLQCADCDTNTNTNQRGCITVNSESRPPRSTTQLQTMHRRELDAVQMTTGSSCAGGYSYHTTLVIFAGWMRVSRKPSSQTKARQARFSRKESITLLIPSSIPRISPNV